VECEVRASVKFGPEKTVRKRLLAERGRHPSTEHLETPEMSYLKKARRIEAYPLEFVRSHSYKCPEPNREKYIHEDNEVVIFFAVLIETIWCPHHAK